MNKKESLLPSVAEFGTPALRRLKQDMNSVFERFFGDFLDLNRWEPFDLFTQLQPINKVNFPKINVAETDSGYSVEIAIAGFDKDDVKLELVDNDLTISAEKQEEIKEESKEYLQREISSRSFRRVVRFPCDVDAGSADASYKNGVISVNFTKAKKEECCGLKIEVK